MRNSVLQQSMIAKHSVEEIHRGFCRGDLSMNRNQMCHLAKSVHEYQNTRSALTIGCEPENKSMETERQDSVAIGNGPRGA